MFWDSGHHQIRPPISEVTGDEIIDWETENLEDFNVLVRKLSKIIREKSSVNVKAEQMVKKYIVGQNILNVMRKQYPTKYERIIKIKEAKEQQIEMFSSWEHGGEHPGKILKEITTSYIKDMEKQMHHSLEYSALQHLSHEAIADWLIGCSLDF